MTPAQDIQNPKGHHVHIITLKVNAIFLNRLILHNGEVAGLFSWYNALLWVLLQHLYSFSWCTPLPCWLNFLPHRLCFYSWCHRLPSLIISWCPPLPILLIFLASSFAIFYPFHGDLFAHIFCAHVLHYLCSFPVCPLRPTIFTLSL